MFDKLTEGFQSALRKMSGSGKLTEANVRDAMDEVRTALLEADVHYEVAAEFCERVVDEALGREVTKALKPGEEMIGIVHAELVKLIGGGHEEGARPGVPKVNPGPTVVMMSGLQGSGKTTTCGKLAAMLKKEGRSVLLAAADLQRPAAVEQLLTVAEQANAGEGSGSVACYAEMEKVAEYGKAVGVAVGVCQRAMAEALRTGVDVLILDTAGRLHVNDELMGELEAVRKAVPPHQVLLVVDAMTGQDAVNSAKSFHERLAIDGVILTKFDSDTRGGAALTVRTVTGAPILFTGVGEHLGQLEPFHAERIAGRILGMGDVVSLVEKAQQEVSEEEAEAMAEKMAKGELSMDDFLKQLRSLRRMGPMKQLLGMLPGVGQMLKDVQVDDKQLDRLEGMVHSMTPAERDDVKVINPSRRRRIATGAGVKPDDVAQLIKQFGLVSQMSKQLSGMGMKGKIEAAKAMQAGGMPGMEGMPSLPGMSGRKSTKTKSPKQRFKKRKR